MTALLGIGIMNKDVKIKILRKLDYKKVPILIRKIDTIFEFIFYYKGEYYNQYFNIQPTKIRGTIALLADYSKKELDNTLKFVYMAATNTIDELQKK